MENVILDVFGALVGAAILGGVCNPTENPVRTLAQRPLSKAQVISTFVVTSLLAVAMIIFHRCSR
jgi:hypothetical protein